MASPEDSIIFTYQEYRNGVGSSPKGGGADRRSRLGPL